MMLFTEKQKEVWQHTIKDGHRWNISAGATRSGKTYLDYFKIPARLHYARDKMGLKMLIGNTQATLERNILEPMRQIWGKQLVGTVKNRNNEVQLFGVKCYAVGADNVRAVDKIRGSGLAYCYGDEITTWAEPVFDMLKSRLDQPHSRFDGTCNPASPSHWFKKFLDSDADIFQQSFSLDDNTFLDPAFVANLKKEYAGTVLFDRYVLGKWAAAEGVIYRLLADQAEQFIIDDLPEDLAYISIGVDWGGNSSAHAAVATAFNKSMSKIVTVREFYLKEIVTPERLYAELIAFISGVAAMGLPIIDIRADSAETTLIAGFNSALVRAGMPYQASLAMKRPIINRIRLYNILLARGAWNIHRSCPNVLEAFRSALYDSKSLDDRRLDNGQMNIDSVDAQEYSTEPYADALLFGQ